MLAVCNLVAFAGVNAHDDLIVEEHVKEPLLPPRDLEDPHVFLSNF